MTHPLVGKTHSSTRTTRNFLSIHRFPHLSIWLIATTWLSYLCIMRISRYIDKCGHNRNLRVAREGVTLSFSSQVWAPCHAKLPGFHPSLNFFPQPTENGSNIWIWYVSCSRVYKYSIKIQPRGLNFHHRKISTSCVCECTRFRSIFRWKSHILAIPVAMPTGYFLYSSSYEATSLYKL